MAINSNPIGKEHFNQIPHYQGIKGKLLGFFGSAIKVYDSTTRDVYYMKVGEITQALLGEVTHLSKKSQALIQERILEITVPDTRYVASQEKIEQLFNQFYQNKTQSLDPLTTPSTIIDELEKIKLDLSDIEPIYYENSLLEVVKKLKPGDIIAKKYHEDNPNHVTTAQKLFHEEGYREAFKFTHLALYLGEINGKYWIAEATVPHEGEAQIRRIQLDDPHFNLLEKNQYLVIRRKDQEAGVEAARLARNYVLKQLPESEQTKKGEFKDQTKYGFMDAGRSLLHKAHFGHFAKHRVFKYYSDYKNGVAFERLGNKSTFFCSQFAMLMESLSELNKNKDFATFLKKHPTPKKYDATKTGLSLKLSKLWYSIRKEVWSRVMTAKYGDQLEKFVQTKLDPLRTSPQDALIYMMDHKDKYQFVGMITHRSDFIKK